MQIWLKIRERNWSRTETIRKEVYELSKESITYTTVLYQRASDGIKYRNNPAGKEHLDFLTERMNLGYHSATSATFTLMACGEPKVSAVAYDTSRALTDLHNTWAMDAVSPTFNALDQLNKCRLEAQGHTDVLLNMVESRWYERNWIFRREKRAKKMLEKAREKHAAETSTLIAEPQVTTQSSEAGAESSQKSPVSQNSSSADHK